MSDEMVAVPVALLRELRAFGKECWTILPWQIKDLIALIPPPPRSPSDEDAGGEVMGEPKLIVRRVGWNWYTYHVVSPPDVDVMGHGTRRFVQVAVRKALQDAQDPAHLEAYLLRKAPSDD